MAVLVHLRNFLSDGATVLFDLVDIGENEGKAALMGDGILVRYYGLDEIHRCVEAADYRFQGVARFRMASVDLTVEDEKLIEDGMSSTPDGNVALIHRILVAATLGPRRNTSASVEQLRRQMHPTLLRRILWRPLPLAVKIRIKRLIVDALGIPIDKAGR
jgi:hypothetical protein